MRPCRLSISRLSDSSLTMMMVLEKVSATATYSASSQPLPSARMMREADDDGEGQLAQPGGQRHRADVADVVQVELQPDDEQQHRDADLRQQVDLFVRADQAEHRRPDDDADHDVGDQHRLAQAHEHRAGHGADQQQQGELAEGGMHAGEV